MQLLTKICIMGLIYCNPLTWPAISFPSWMQRDAIRDCFLPQGSGILILAPAHWKLQKVGKETFWHNRNATTEYY